MKINKSIIVIILIITFLVSCKRDKIIITGSETMYPMLQVLANDYNAVQGRVRASVNGGGSILGLKRLVLNQTDFAASSHEIDRAIKDQLASIDNYKIIVIAYDGIAIVVNKNNAVEKLHLKQTSDIFAGRINNWKDVGGINSPIKVLVRDDHSGTASYMKEHILRLMDLGDLIYERNKYVEYTEDAQSVIDNREMSEIISKNINAIGYMGMGSAVTEGKGKVKKIRYSIKKEGPYYEPNIKTVQDSRYELSRPLSLVYKPDNNGKRDRFITYINSVRAKRGVLRSGYLDSFIKDIFLKPLDIKGKKPAKE